MVKVRLVHSSRQDVGTKGQGISFSCILDKKEKPGNLVQRLRFRAHVQACRQEMRIVRTIVKKP